MRRDTSGWIDAHSIGDGVSNITGRSKSATDLETCIACVSRTLQHIARPRPSCLPGVNLLRCYTKGLRSTKKGQYEMAIQTIVHAGAMDITRGIELLDTLC